ncbi:MAG: proton-conducting membrane transporter [Anaerolinea sp.]|nr:proton-conducting membrane transporter [Anaerolinea sp.]
MALLLPLLPLAASGLLLVLRGYPRALAPAGVVALLATLALGGWAAATEPTIGWDWSPAIRTGLAIEGFSRVMVILVPAIATPIFVYAAATEKEGRLRLLALMLAFTGAMLLLVSAADFLMLVTAWELVGATSWALIGHGWRDSGNARSAAQAFVTTRAGDLGLYLAAGALFAATGSFALNSAGRADGWELNLIAAGVLVAAAAKSAQVPFSPWLFSAMAGPTPVSALLHSATLVAGGAYLLIRVAPQLDAVDWFTPAVAATGLATAIAGGTVAGIQPHAKRALAGSTSAQYGLMFVAVGASSTAAAGAHLVTHAAFKSLLFLGAGVAIHASGTHNLAGMRLGRVLPRVAALSAVGALALAAFPPLGGAWTKEEIVAAGVHASPWLGAGVFVAGFLSAFYAARYQILAYGPGVASRGDGGAMNPEALHHRPGGWEVGSLAVLAGATLGLSLLWLPGAAALVEDAAGGELFPSAPWELAVSVAAIVLALGSVWLLARQRRLGTLGLPGGLQEAAADWLGLPTITRLLVVTPVITLSRLLARFDDLVVDAGVRAVGRLARTVSKLLSLRVEWTFDGAVRAVAAATMQAALGSRTTDEAGIDGAVEGTARAVGTAGEQSRRLQTGLAHHYYVVLAAGLAASVAALALLGLQQ